MPCIKPILHLATLFARHLVSEKVGREKVGREKVGREKAGTVPTFLYSHKQNRQILTRA